VQQDGSGHEQYERNCHLKHASPVGRLNVGPCRPDILTLIVAGLNRKGKSASCQDQRATSADAELWQRRRGSGRRTTNRCASAGRTESCEREVGQQDAWTLWPDEVQLRECSPSRNA
jgi:hypothetical protein